MICRSVVPFVALLLAAAGCSATAQSEFDVAQEVLDHAREQANEFGQAILEDGRVSPAEREAAFLQFAACIESNGMKVENYRLRVHGARHFDNSNPPEMADEVVLRLQDECLATEFEPVDVVYVEQHRRSAAEEASFMESVASCMETSGFAVARPASYQSPAEASPSTYAACIDRLDP